MNELDIITDNLDDMAEAIDNRHACSEAVKYLRALKPIVPQAIADWFEEYDYYGVAEMIQLAQDVKSVDESVYDAFLSLSKQSPTYYYDDMVAVTIVAMNVFGYEVQEWN